jgi:hypothetical protein
MNGIHRILTALAGIVLALAAAPAADASITHHGGGPAGTPAPPVFYPCSPGCSPLLGRHPILSHGHPTGAEYRVHTVVVGGTPGWQIALIAAGAALLAATVAVLAYRAWTARRKPVTTPA